MDVSNGGNLDSLREHALDLLRIGGYVLFAVLSMFVTVLWWIGRGIYRRLDAIERACAARQAKCGDITRERERQLGELKGRLDERDRL